MERHHLSHSSAMRFSPLHYCASVPALPRNSRRGRRSSSRFPRNAGAPALAQAKSASPSKACAVFADQAAPALFSGAGAGAFFDRRHGEDEFHHVVDLTVGQSLVEPRHIKGARLASVVQGVPTFAKARTLVAHIRAQGARKLGEKLI